MAENGKLEKMLILAFETAEEAENGGHNPRTLVEILPDG